MTFFALGISVAVIDGMVFVRVGWTGRGNKPARVAFTRDASLKIAATLIEALRHEEFEVHLAEGPTTISRKGQTVRFWLGEPRWRWRPKCAPMTLSTTTALVKAFVDAAQMVGSVTHTEGASFPTRYATTTTASVPAS
jgi:hypothetical protein